MIEVEGIPRIYQGATLVVAFLVAVIGHEIMHGYVAYRYGDYTAYDAGRLSINPIVHIDPVGSILVPALLYFSGAPFLFGWAKPVPINIRTILNQGGYNAGIAVALAGITYNFALAILATLLLGITHIDGIFSALIALFLAQLIIYNVVLGVFNLWPIPPLDGSQALGFFCTKYGLYAIPRAFDRLERYGMIILVVIIATPLSDYFFYPVRLILGFLL
ncbi:MAG: site-2 protease family protein [Wolinella sp.]